MVTREWTRGDWTISTRRERLDLDVIHRFLVRSYWATGIPRDVVARAIAHSLCFGLYERDAQVGFARLVTDYATFAHVMDVFVLERCRGQGLGKWLVEVMVTCPELQGFRQWTLGTKDAHGLYRQLGFAALGAPENRMERLDPDVYARRR
jgi:GNAT superfamily N-acetyltransferase